MHTGSAQDYSFVRCSSAMLGCLRSRLLVYQKINLKMVLRYISTRGDIGLRSQSSLTCIACGDPLHEVMYQARSVDEPPCTVALCLVCPLNPGKLGAGGPWAATDYGKGHPIPGTRSQPPRFVGHNSSGPLWALSVVGADDAVVLQVLISEEFAWCALPDCSASARTTPRLCQDLNWSTLKKNYVHKTNTFT